MSKTVQDFVFETDDLEHLEKVLATILPVFFPPPKHSTKYTEYQIRTKKDFWRDTSELSRHDAGPFIWEDTIGKQTLFLEHSATFGGAAELKEAARASGLDHKNKAAKLAYNAHQKANVKKPNRKLIAVLQDYKQDKPDYRFKSLDAMKDTTMELVQRVKPETFMEEFGDGYNDWFNGDDGSVEHGWRLHYEPIGGWNQLVVSMVHIYYGK